MFCGSFNICVRVVSYQRASHAINGWQVSLGQTPYKSIGITLFG